MKKAQLEFVLPSGVRVVATELYGEHHEILTRQGEDDKKRVNKLIQSLLISVGSVKYPNEEFVEGLRSEDRRHILAMCRQATMDYEKVFEFTHKFQDEDGNMQTLPLKVNLNDQEDAYTEKHIQTLVDKFGAEDEEFYRELNKDGTFRATPSKHRASEYSDLPKEYETELPKSGLKVKINHLTGKGERQGASIDRKNISVNTLLKMRNPRYLHDNGTWIQLNLNNVHSRDLEHLRKLVKENEGEVEMELRFENPAKGSDKYVTVDLLSEIAFFFPSEVLK
jgi:hypothetical protein